MIRRFINRNLLDKWGWGVGIADFYTAISRFVIRPTWLRSFLHGTWLGHPLHPLLTDVPIGGLTIAIVLDLFGVYDGANWATGLGVLGLIGAAIAGFVDLDETDGKPRQYGGVHSTIMLAAILVYVVSMLVRLGVTPSRLSATRSSLPARTSAATSSSPSGTWSTGMRGGRAGRSGPRST